MANDVGDLEGSLAWRAVRELLRYIGEDLNRDGLVDTPLRVIKSYKELFSGYGVNVSYLFKTFEEKCDEMVVLRDIEFYSTCEHHMLPFIGVAHVAYIPNGKVIGISKLARLVEVYSRRLTIQERICSEVTTALEAGLQPQGAACIIEAKHLCISCRGINKQNSVMVTSSLTGKFRDAAVRQELFSLIGK